MRLDRFAKAMTDQYLSNGELAIIRKSATEMMQNIHTEPAGTVLLKLLNHIDYITLEAIRK